MSRFKGEDAKRLQNPDSWDETDVLYLRDRGMLPYGYTLPKNLQPSAPTPVPIGEMPNTGDALPADEDEIMFDDTPLSDMRKDQLQIEARNRGIDDGGTVRELRERIEAFDANTP